MSRTAFPKLIDSHGRPITVADKPIAVGGEGKIYAVVGDSSIVAKVYNQPQVAERGAKLKAMAELATPDLLKIAAWPTATLHQKENGPVTGILMPRIVGCKEVHHLYSVAQRKKDYPEANWKFLTHAAVNCAIAFEEVHRHSHVIGDVNQKNVLVSNRAVVQFVDCDSFQVRASNGRVYRCVVGVPEYTPPELQGKSFRDVDRTLDHDRFGLAVLIFHLLMMGRHPFSGIYLDQGDMPIEKAIQGRRFAYSTDVQATRMKPPPNTLPISVLDRSLLDLFERAFRLPGKHPSMSRPTAAEWKHVLSTFRDSLVGCRVDAKHVFPKRVGACPWCDLFSKTNVFFFLPGIPSVTGRGQFDLLALWTQIECIPCPDDNYSRPGPSNLAANTPSPIPPHISKPSPRPRLHPAPIPPKGLDTFLDKVAGVGLLAGVLLLAIAPPIGALCLVGFGVWSIFLFSTRERRHRAQDESYRVEVKRVQDLNDQLERLWEAENPEWAHEFKKRKRAFERLDSQLAKQESDVLVMLKQSKASFTTTLKNLESNKAAYENSKAAYTHDLTELTKRSAQIQLERHLDGHLIRSARLKAMTTDRILSLSSFGIETALDVEKLANQKVPGIGPVLTQRLREWRESLERSFKPQPGLPSAERATVDQRHLPRLRQIESVLSDGPRQLREIAAQYQSRRKNALAQIQETVDPFVRARRAAEDMERMAL
jgi:DNA-binding helix-hairpin-helix protein with protein kinase domain